MPYSSYLLNLYGCSVVTLLTSLLLQWSLKCLWDHPRVATIISLWMSWKNSRVYASVISRDGRSRNLGQIMLSKCWKRTQQQWENQRFVMMSWTKRATVHFGEDEENWEDYPKSALLALNASIHIIHTPMQRMLENVDQSITIIKISLIIPQDMSTNNCSPLNTCLQVKVVSYGLGFYDFDEILGFTMVQKTMHCLLLLWLSIIFQTWGPFKYFVVHTAASVFFVTSALWGACHRHNWGLCINSDWSYDCSIVGHKLDIRQHVVKKNKETKMIIFITGENLNSISSFCSN